MRAEARAACLAIAALVGGCGPLPVSLSDATRQFDARDWERLFDHWTREKKAFNLDTMDNGLSVSATYMSWELRQAWVERRSEDEELDEAGRLALLEQQRAQWEQWDEFVVTSTATRHETAEFTHEDSPWVITLRNSEGLRVEPATVEKIPDPSPAMRAYFPTITTYRMTFVMRFPRTDPASGARVISPGIEAFMLVFTGALGKAELVWKVK